MGEVVDGHRLLDPFIGPGPARDHLDSRVADDRIDVGEVGGGCRDTREAPVVEHDRLDAVGLGECLEPCLVPARAPHLRSLLGQGLCECGTEPAGHAGHEDAHG